MMINGKFDIKRLKVWILLNLLCGVNMCKVE